jgi:hypothetical protein
VKATRNYSNLTIEIEASDQVDLFKQLAAMDDVFGDMQAAAMIDDELVTSDDVMFVVRTDKEDNDYFELRCKSGPLEWFKKRFGQYKKGNQLFAKNRPADGEIPGLRGWSKYAKDGEGVQEARRPDASNLDF